MARKYDVTRFVCFTTATVHTVDRRLNPITIEDAFTLKGHISVADCEKKAIKLYGNAYVDAEDVKYIMGMRGMFLDEVAKYGVDIEPYNRKDWDASTTEEEKKVIRQKYYDEVYSKSKESKEDGEQG